MCLTGKQAQVKLKLQITAGFKSRNQSRICVLQIANNIQTKTSSKVKGRVQKCLLDQEMSITGVSPSKGNLQ